MGLAGNLIWATACFATGGTAFAISLAGIAVGTLPNIPSDAPEFVKWADDNLITEITKNAKGQVDKVTRDIAAGIPATGWDDNKIRAALLGTRFRPEYIETVAGGIPNIDRAAIRHRVNVDVLVRANSQVADPHPLQNPGFVRYHYRVKGYFNGQGRDWYYGDKLQPVDSWGFEFKEATLELNLGGEDAVAEIKKDSQIEPANMPLVKLVVLEGEDGQTTVLVLDSNNKFFANNSTSPMWHNIDGPAVISHLWQSSAGQPPPIKTSSLTR